MNTNDVDAEPEEKPRRTVNDLPEPIGPRPDWFDDAACVDAPTSEFFGDADGGTYSTTNARRRCQTCPVRRQCLDYAVNVYVTRHGIWGGLTPNQRDQYRRGRIDANGNPTI